MKAIEQWVKDWDWKSQKYSDLEDSGVAQLISKIERWFYQTEEIDIHIQSLDLSNYQVWVKDLYDFAIHYRLVENANFDYPVIMNKRWFIVDWRHRIVKAIIEWRETIKWIRILDSDLI
jgi:hypothetical protein